MLRHLIAHLIAAARADVRRAAAPAALLLSLAGLVAAAPAFAQSTAATAAIELDRVVAVVNSEAITAHELALRVTLARRQLREQNIEVPPADVLGKQVLERMIVDRAQQQAAREMGIRIDDAQVDRALAGIAQENKLTLAQLRERVEREGTGFARFRDDVREEIVSRRLREREIDSRIQVSDADVDAFLASQPKGAQPGAELHVAQILLAIPEGANAEQIERQRLRGAELVDRPPVRVARGDLRGALSRR